MTTNELTGKTAVILGASSSVGLAATRALLAEGVKVVAVGRHTGALEPLRAEAPGSLQVRLADWAAPGTALELFAELEPTLVLLAGGVRPHMAPLDELSWESFSEAWHGDTQAAFHAMKAALRTPLEPGSTVAIVSSGAAARGSPLSGGYAGAKRMQWFLADYAQKLADQRQAGLRFVTLVPQLLAETEIGKTAAAAYGAVPSLTTQGVAAAILDVFRGSLGGGGGSAVSVSAKGAELLA